MKYKTFVRRMTEKLTEGFDDVATDEEEMEPFNPDSVEVERILEETTEVDPSYVPKLQQEKDKAEGEAAIAAAEAAAEEEDGKTDTEKKDDEGEKAQSEKEEENEGSSSSSSSSSTSTTSTPIVLCS